MSAGCWHRDHRPDTWPLELELPGSVAQRPVPLLARYIRVPPPQSVPRYAAPAGLPAFYLAVRSAAADGVEISRRLRNVGTPDVVAKGLSIARHYSSRDETPFADIDLNVRPAGVPCGAQRLRSLKDSLENRVPGWTRRAWRPGGTGAMMTVALGGVTKKKAGPGPQERGAEELVRRAREPARRRRTASKMRTAGSARGAGNGLRAIPAPRPGPTQRPPPPPDATHRYNRV